jgi:D-lactate dehydrogenase (cytochrome)
MPTTTNHQALTLLFPSPQLVIDPVELITYEIDAGFDRGKPDGVFYAQSAADVSRIVRWAGEQHIPLIARGAGTGLSGGAVPEHGGVIVEFARMNRVLDLDVRGRSAVVEPGVINLALDALVKREGLYYPPDPSSGRASVIGGNIGENAGGPHCFKYGVTTNYVTGLEVVLADGQIVRAGGQALDYPEYDLCGLFVGSEGTLGIVTQAQVRLIRNPPGVKTMMAAFDSVEQAGEAVSAVIAAGLVPATLEMMDQKVMGMIEAYAAPGLPVEAGAGLIVEVDGYPASLDAQMEEVADLISRHGAFQLRIAQSEEERQKIWYGRKSAAGAVARLAPTFYLVDVTVPRSQLAAALAAVNEVCDRYELRTGHVFHAGDGNLHPLILCDARNPELMQRVFRACDEIVALCIARDGSITGEHGVGIEKRKYMPAMYTGAELSAMFDLKRLLDPHGLLNPGKIFPEEIPQAVRATPLLPGDDTWTPANAGEAASGLAALAQAGKTVRIGSAATGDRSWGKNVADVWLSTEKLAGVKLFAPNDLYVAAGAGMLIQELQNFLAAHQMQAPLAAPWPGASVGGVIAANINAPLRTRYGALRDVVLSVTVAMADGRVIRAGRNVVKNVAGYDLTKLFIGAYGTLGLLTEATFKLIPRPRSRRTLAAPVDTIRQGLAWAAWLMPHLLVTSGLVLVQNESIAGLSTASYTLLLTAEGVPEDVAAEIDEAQTLLHKAGATCHETPHVNATEAWSSFLGTTSDEQILTRTGVPARTLSAYFDILGEPAQSAANWFIDVANGILYARSGAPAAPGSVVEANTWLAAIREPALALGGYTVAMAMPATLHGSVDPWGYQPGALALMQGLKTQWDPTHTLNPGTFLVG